eukprot:SAG31_NODE_23009_length_513_cov_1.099034_1_plen_59_part_10
MRVLQCTGKHELPLDKPDHRAATLDLEHGLQHVSCVRIVLIADHEVVVPIYQPITTTYR